MRTSSIAVAVALLLAVPAFGQSQQQKPATAAPGQQQQQQPKQQQKQQVQKFANCREAIEKTPGYSQVAIALQNCPDLANMQQDPTTANTFFVPSDKAVKNMAAFVGVPASMVSSPQFKGIMCNVLKYHVVPGVFLKKNWSVGQQLVTSYNKMPLKVSAIGQQPQITTSTGAQANIKRVSFCGNSVAFGIDTVLTPFKVPKLGRTKTTV